jgi:hypothetical protein
MYNIFIPDAGRIRLITGEFMTREELLAALKVLSESAQVSPDSEVATTSIVLLSLRIALMTETTVLLANNTTQYCQANQFAANACRG